MILNKRGKCRELKIRTREGRELEACGRAS